MHEVLLRPAPADQAALPLSTEDVLRYVWESRWGEMLIEVSDSVAYVNGQRVEPADLRPDPMSRTSA